VPCHLDRAYKIKTSEKWATSYQLFTERRMSMHQITTQSQFQAHNLQHNKSVHDSQYQHATAPAT